MNRISKTGYRGVTFHGGQYISRITCEKQTLFLGRYNTAIQAAKIYDKFAKEIYKDKALLNFK